MTEADRYARQRLIPWWDQQRLADARVLVAGAGALGNEVLKNLALLGVGQLVIIDFDRVEPANLSRTVLFGEADLGRPKVEAASAALTRLNPEIRVSTIDGDIAYDLGLGWLRHCRLAIGCLDNLAARRQLGLACSLAGIPHLDGGMWSLGGEVRWFTGGDGPCFACTLNADDYARATQRHSCSGFSTAADEETQVPTLVTTAAIIGGLLAQEAVKWLCGRPVASGKVFVYNGQTMTLHRSTLTRNADCPVSHTPYAAVRELPYGAGGLTPRELLEMTRGAGAEAYQEPLLVLGRDILLSLQCPGCEVIETIQRPLGQVAEARQFCPRCGVRRHADVIRTVGMEDYYADRPLAELGVPPGEVLAVQVGEALRLYELTGDIIGGLGKP